jgi:hypothetical protein
MKRKRKKIAVVVLLTIALFAPGRATLFSASLAISAPKFTDYRTKISGRLCKGKSSKERNVHANASEAEKRVARPGAKRAIVKRTTTAIFFLFLFITFYSCFLKMLFNFFSYFKTLLIST